MDNFIIGITCGVASVSIGVVLGYKLGKSTDTKNGANLANPIISVFRKNSVKILKKKQPVPPEVELDNKMVQKR